MIVRLPRPRALCHWVCVCLQLILILTPANAGTTSGFMDAISNLLNLGRSKARKEPTVRRQGQVIVLPRQQQASNRVFSFPRAQATGDVCVLPQLIGTGPYRIPRWYFNPNTRRCELFYYSGCCGNGNNFPTFEACQVLCEVDPCTQDRDPGVGSMQIPRYFFNRNTKLCEQFSYFGSGGNRNNFQSLDECRRVCNEDPNPCAFGPAAMSGNQRLQCSFQSLVTNACPSTYYCHVGRQPQTTVCCPKGPGDKCTQPLRAGIGNDAMTRWYFDPVGQQCRTFQYNGLQGNENNFLTQAECDNACFVNPCSQGEPYRSGNNILQCSALNSRICPSSHFCHVGADQKTTVCCPNLGPDPCEQTIVNGMGQRQINRWFFNTNTGNCEQFSYRGAKGNQNNFINEEQCSNMCKVFENVCAQGDPLLSKSNMPISCLDDSDCPATHWCHFGSKPETTMCCSGALPNPCTLPIASGSGTDTLSRWAFDNQARRCVPFSYGGRFGNQNSFHTRLQCQRQCPEFENPCPSLEPILSKRDNGVALPISCFAIGLGSSGCGPGAWCHVGEGPATTMCCPGDSDPCKQPLVRGRGLADLKRWYFDANTKSCVSFTYGGLKGNANNFLTAEDCAAKCPVFHNPCAIGQPETKFGGARLCDPDSKNSCSPGYYCHVGENVNTTCCCLSVGEACHLTMTPGQGNANLPRFYYNSASRQCQKFTYRGMKGNDNNFLSLEQCGGKCPVFTNPCEEQQSNLLTNSVQSEFQFSCARSKYCPPSYWCHYGATPETTVCCLKNGDRCEQPRVPGNGNANLRRFYYDSTSRSCQEFTYGGLYGNANNFLSLSECEEACPTWVNPCSTGQPILIPGLNRPQTCRPDAPCQLNYWCHLGATPDTTVCCPGAGDPCNTQFSVGIGDASLSRWYYDQPSRTCRPFTYRGLRGNVNNFLSRSDCEATCPVWVNPCQSGQPILGANGLPEQCDPLTINSCPLTHWCHAGSEPATTVCCPGAQDPCAVSMTEGEGQFSLMRFYFDRNERQCKQFTYRGLKGNQNNFMSQSLCEQSCPVFKDPCPNSFGQSSLSQVRTCSRERSTCPTGSWCHFGADADTTLCCPNAGDACNQPVARGQGSNNLPRWYYDSTSRECVRFAYLGMKGNQNNFLSKSDCEQECPVFVNPCPNGDPILSNNRPQVCSPQFPCPSGYWCHIGDPSAQTTVCCQSSGDPCQQPMRAGTGTANLLRWYYNPIVKRCQTFTYRGLKGSQNNFLSQEDCEQACNVFENPCAAGEPLTGVTGRPLQCTNDPSVCRANYWCHRGPTTETTVCCPPSGGQQCAQRMDQGVSPTDSPNTSLQRWYYDSQRHQCVQFFYRGMKGNQNNFLTQDECARTCPVYTNPCVGGRPMMDANNFPVTCSRGNPNPCNPSGWCHIGDPVANPTTTLCCPGRVSDDQRCQLPMEQGSGQSSLRRWYYNRLTRQCVSFTYRGLMGNQNNFLSASECASVCDVVPNPCAQGQPATSPGGGPRFCSQLNPACPSAYWCHFGADRRTTLCCPGAIPRDQVCQLPVVRGSGDTSLNRWYYNPRTHQCEQFNYAGLLGNQNSFLNEADCAASCPVYENVCRNGDPQLGSGMRPVPCSFGSGACRANYWCHLGSSSVTTMCCPGALPWDNGRGSAGPACELPMNQGEGTEFLSRWYADTTSKECRTFTYRGKKGNQNNFETRQQCETTCVMDKGPCVQGPVNSPIRCQPGGFNTCPTGQWCHVGAPSRPEDTTCCPGAGNACTQPLRRGEGTSSLGRFYYDSASQTCLQFTYRGRYGNQNNFLTKEACETTCDVRPNPCATGQPYRSSDGTTQTCNALTTTSSCPTSYWCHVGAALDTTVCCPGELSGNRRCELPMETGTGDAALPRYYFNPSTKRCDRFTYRGMKGNQNNFVSLEQCRLGCRAPTNPCIGQPATSPSGQVIYCSASNKENCPVNFWCHLGATPETTLCCPGATNPCSVPLAPGTGNDNLQRWYYNADSRACVPFTYNGIRGNQNNFMTRSSCDAVCPVWQNPCAGEPEKDSRGRPRICSPLIPMSCGFGFFCLAGDPTLTETSYCCPAMATDPCAAAVAEGVGDASLQRWYFNPVGSRCERFTYRGRRGNENNFLSREDCDKACIPDINPCYPGDQPYKRNGRNVLCKEGFGGCPGDHYCHIGENQFSTVCCPQRGNPCDQQRLVGSGRASLKRWYYNSLSDACMTFTYSGIAGNQNNFNSQTQCETACPGFRGYCPHGKPLLLETEPQSCGVDKACPSDYVCHVSNRNSRSICCFDPAYFCTMPRDPGPCRDFGTRYGYNRNTGTCTPFRYGGCAGNLNNFDTLEKCTELNFAPSPSTKELAATPAQGLDTTDNWAGVKHLRIMVVAGI